MLQAIFSYHGFHEDEITHVIDSRGLSVYTLSESSTNKHAKLMLKQKELFKIKSKSNMQFYRRTLN
jgi:hypothetical protein